jgi:glycosyltransferase involved in cell wall biosynthesis
MINQTADIKPKKELPLKILMIGLYPIIQPIHGGQLRARAIYERYLEEGYDVRYHGFFGKGWYDDIDQTDFEIPIRSDVPIYEHAPDAIVSKMILENSETLMTVRSLLEDYGPDVIQFEQPFLYEAFQSILKEHTKTNRLRIIYSSHNIEADLKRDILSRVSDSRVSKQDKDKIEGDVWAMEKKLARDADTVIACTNSDAERLKSAGAHKILIIKNGIDSKPKTTSSAEIAHWRRWREHKRIRTLFVFIGSAHPPNATGFLNMIGEKVGFLPHHIGIAVIGGVGDLLQTYLNSCPEHIRETFNLRVHLLGKLTDAHLAAMLEISDVVLLPIDSGGGSNLKTAEAILSGKPIIGTTTAFRSYEEYVGSPEIVIANTRVEFQEAITRLADSNLSVDYRQESRDKVTWKYILRNLPQEVIEA